MANIKQPTMTVHVVAIVAIVGISVGAACFKPDQALTIFTFCGTVLAALISILKGQADVHAAVDGTLHDYIAVAGEARKAEGVLEGHEQEKKLHPLPRKKPDK